MIHAAAPCPAEIKRQMIEWWGDAIDEYYAATEGGGTLVTAEEWLEQARARSACRGRRARSSSSTRTATTLPPGESAPSTCAWAAPSSSTSRTRRKTEANRRGRVLHRRRRRLPRRGRLPVPLRPQVGHDHLGRRQHLPGRDRGRAARPPRSADVAVFGIPNEDWGEEIKAVVEPAAGVEPGDGSPRSCSRSAATTSPSSSSRARSTTRRDAARPQRQALQAQAPRPLLGGPRPRDLICAAVASLARLVRVDVDMNGAVELGHRPLEVVRRPLAQVINEEYQTWPIARGCRPAARRRGAAGCRRPSARSPAASRCRSRSPPGPPTRASG